MRRTPIAARGLSNLAAIALMLAALFISAEPDESSAGGEEVLVASGSIWHFLDDGSDPGALWMAGGFDDSAWPAGPAPLGYGDPMSTTVGYGPAAGAKFMTTYFRRTFVAADPAAVQVLTVNLRRDDGAVVYLNGIEVLRSNMPAGPITPATAAATTVSGPDEIAHFSYPVPLSALVAGTNVIAVEVHQDSAASSDIGFDLALLAAKSPPPIALPPAVPGATRFAVIGDYGDLNSQPNVDVAALVHSWEPQFVMTVGDNNYCSVWEWDTCVGRYYHDYMYPYKGAYGAGAGENRFWPALGNHDWDADVAAYLAYFTLPNNGRYYDLVRGNVHFFVVDSDSREPDGATFDSPQYRWIRDRMLAATDRWKIVIIHEPAYSSGMHGNNPAMQWEFAQWGASAVLQGHDHIYERLDVAGLPYFVNGLGGRSLYGYGSIKPQSVVRYNADYGAMLVEATDCALSFQFIERHGGLIDHYEKTAADCGSTPSPTASPTPAPVSTPTATPVPVAAAPMRWNVLVPAGSRWRYLDGGADPGSGWQAAQFSDSGWRTGAAPLGFGDPMSTTIDGGPAGARYTTVYFRRAFSVLQASEVQSLTVRVRRDDGAIVYLNGAEVVRSNMPAGTVTPATLASTNVVDADETRFFAYPIPGASLMDGRNVLAVEVHQSGSASSDLGFDLRLSSAVPAGAARFAGANPTTFFLPAVHGDVH